VQYTSEAACTVENGEEVERMKSRGVDGDAKREARIRNEFAYGDNNYTFMFRLLDEARAEIARLRAELETAQELHRELMLSGALPPDEDHGLRAPPEADATKRARNAIARVISPQRWANLNAGEESRELAEAEKLLAEYGEQRAREGRTEYVEESRRLREACVAAARADERAKAATLARGEVYKERYRTWPWYGDGNRADWSNRVRFVDALADAILASAPPQPEGGEG
jgi:hypothetical protein